MAELGDLSFGFEIQLNYGDYNGFLSGNKLKEQNKVVLLWAMQNIPKITELKKEWLDTNGYSQINGHYDTIEERDFIIDSLTPFTIEGMNPEYCAHWYYRENKKLLGICKNCRSPLNVDGSHYHKTDCENPEFSYEEIPNPANTKEMIQSDKYMLAWVVLNESPKPTFWGNPQLILTRD